MPNAYARNRIVVFCLTQEEYGCLRDACSAKNGRNLSEFTRSELMAMLTSQSMELKIEVRLYALEDRLSRLERAVGKLITMLASSEPVPPQFPGLASEREEPVTE